MSLLPVHPSRPTIDWGAMYEAEKNEFLHVQLLKRTGEECEGETHLDDEGYWYCSRCNAYVEKYVDETSSHLAAIPDYLHDWNAAMSAFEQVMSSAVVQNPFNLAGITLTEALGFSPPYDRLFVWEVLQEVSKWTPEKVMLALLHIFYEVQ